MKKIMMLALCFSFTGVVQAQESQTLEEVVQVFCGLVPAQVQAQCLSDFGGVIEKLNQLTAEAQAEFDACASEGCQEAAQDKLDQVNKAKDEAKDEMLAMISGLI